MGKLSIFLVFSKLAFLHKTYYSLISTLGDVSHTVEFCSDFSVVKS